MISLHTAQHLENTKVAMTSGCLLMLGITLGLMLVMLATAMISYNLVSWRLAGHTHHDTAPRGLSV